MPVTIATPDNSFVQLTSVNSNAPYDECIENIQECLPALRGDDIRFQIIFTGLRGQSLTPHPAPSYILKVVNSAGEIITLVPPEDDPTEIFAEIEMSEHDDFDVGTFQQPDLEDLVFADFMEVGTCFTICLYRMEYWWTVPTPAPGDYLVNIYVDGVLNGSLFTFALTDLQSIADALNTYELGFFYVEDGIRIRVSPVDGEVYGDILIGPVLLATPISVHQEDVKTHCSNCFVVIADDCFTSVVKYRGNEDQFGFYYETENTFYNVQRLWLYYDNPQPIDDENYFRLSDGTKKVLSASYEKEYEAHTEYFNEQRHFALKAALKHDVLRIGDTAFAATLFTAEGKYDIGWLNKPGTNLDAAPASFKIRPTPFYQVNSNCE